MLPPELAAGALGLGRAGRWRAPTCGSSTPAARELPPGEPGEIVMRGPTLMDGYHGAPEATRDALVDGWLHTGDIGRDRRRRASSTSWTARRT